MKQFELSRAAESLQPSGIRKFFDLAANMKGVISLGVGEPDFVTPWNVRQACIHSFYRTRIYVIYSKCRIIGAPSRNSKVSKKTICSIL